MTIPKIIVPHHYKGEPIATLYEDPSGLTKTAFSTNDALRAFMQKFSAKKDHGYPLISALGSYETFGINNNMDLFRKSQLLPVRQNPERLSGFRTFLNAKVYRHHNNKPSSPSFGNVVEAFWNEKMGRVELLLELPVSLNEKELADIEAGRDVAWSMGAKVRADVCTACGNVAPTRREYCIHLRTQLGHIMPDATVIAMDNLSPCFFDISCVTIPADKTSYQIMMVNPSDYQLEKAALLDFGIFTNATQHSGYPMEINTFGSEKVADDDYAAMVYQATVLNDRPDAADLLRKYASLPESVMMGAIAEEPIKRAMRRKTADIDKLVPLEPLGVTDGLHGIYAKFRESGLSRLRRAEPEMTSEHVDELSSAAGDTKALLSTLAAYGVILKPTEYQRLMLGNMGKMDERSALDESKRTILDAHPVLHPDDAVTLDHRLINHDHAEALADLIAAKSYHRGAMSERVKSKLPDNEGYDEVTEVMEDDPLLSRIGGAYEDYAKKAMAFARQVAAAAESVFGDGTKLSVRLGIPDGHRGLPAVAMGAPIKEAADAMEREYGFGLCEKIKAAGAALQKTASLPDPVVDGIILENLT